MTSSLEKFVRPFNSRIAERDRAELSAKKAKEFFERIFDGIPNSRDENGRPIDCRAPRIEAQSGVLVQLDQTNHFGGPGHCYNLSVVDEDDVFHGYAQIRPHDTTIMYWESESRRLAGSAEQDDEVLEILEQGHAEII